MKLLITVFLCLFVATGRGQTIVFEEDFNSVSGEGGNDGMFSGGLQSQDLSIYKNWKLKGIYGGKGCIRFGDSNSKGKAVMPTVQLKGEGELRFRAAGWDTKKEKPLITLRVKGATIEGEREISLTKSSWNTYRVKLTEAEGNVEIAFDAQSPLSKSPNRFFLDDVVVTEIVPTLPFTITDAGYSTFFTDKAYVMPQGVIGNTVTLEGENIVLTPHFREGDRVPPQTPLLLQGKQGTYAAAITQEEVPLFTEKNDLKGTLTERLVTSSSGTKLYVLAKDQVNGIGFYWANGTEGNRLNNKAGKCYLEVPQAVGVQGFRLGNSLIGLGFTPRFEIRDREYDLFGRHAGTSAHGIRIVNGQKVFR
ncbi:hypothetical protein EII14_03430 [Alloprevotella sp. OH1205_COT-284]|uniref:hypothetical protein n=1 Tax=Alloprevotella sp. OH1205_COT-284 TaxID=2491043 RepID=UPI000F5DF799|nr:hypothetical protein [Alloprevotella sp. OH1205_COT-284]RRD80219.1 hypothetical protein EII14_03430 [Alloprevotella sp. OH1205_COT-284]